MNLFTTIRTTGVDSWVVKLASDREHIFGSEDYHRLCVAQQGLNLLAAVPPIGPTLEAMAAHFEAMAVASGTETPDAEGYANAMRAAAKEARTRIALFAGNIPGTTPSTPPSPRA